MNKKHKILTILGARPQFIKAGSVSRIIKQSEKLSEVIVHTGQHFDANMSDIFFNEMKIPKPDYNLGIGGKSHGHMTGQMIEKIEDVVFKENPDLIMVYGDTNSTLAGAIVASKVQIKLVHIEAGLRSFNMAMPEEVNRIVTDRLSNILFCPTDTAVQNLKNEGFDNFDNIIIKCGDVMQDGAFFYKKYAKKPSIDIDENYILCTIHRAENTDNLNHLNNIFEALDEISLDKQIILPIHPRTKKIIDSNNIQLNKNIKLIDPVGYLEMIWLIDNCDMVMTDSGGLQKEAFFFSKKCITLRNETEWVELVNLGANKLVGADKDKIINTYFEFSQEENIDFDQSIYGNGNACKIIVSELEKIEET